MNRKKSLKYITASQNKHELQKTSFHFIKERRISKNTVSQFDYCTWNLQPVILLSISLSLKLNTGKLRIDTEESERLWAKF